MTVQEDMVLALINAGVPLDKITASPIGTITIDDDDSLILVDSEPVDGGEWWYVSRHPFDGVSLDSTTLYDGDSQDDAVKAVIRALG